MKHTKLESQLGAIAVMTALLLPLILGFAALALDGGYVLLNKNRMQVAADAAALVAAGSRQHGQDINTAIALAQTASQANGFAQGFAQTTVTVAIPPGGVEVFANDSNYVRVTVSQPVNAFLSWIFGINQTSTTAMAVAGPSGSSLPCMLTLASSSPGALVVEGNALVTANTCGIYVNSSNASAMQVSGNVTVTASTIHVVGDFKATGNVTITPIPTVGAPVTPNPFAALPMPTFSGCTFTQFSRSGNGSLTLTPGTYCGGIKLTGNYAVNFDPGMYVLYGGGLNFSGNISPVRGTGVSFYNTGNSSNYPYRALNLAGNISMNLTAPTSGTYSGMLFMQDPLNTLSASLVGNAGALLAGNLYFPKNKLTLTGNTGTDIPIGTVVALKVSVQGNTKFSMTNTYGNGSGGNLRSGLYK